MPWSWKHTSNNHLRYRKHISKAWASETCIFVNWVLDLFQHRSKAVCDKAEVCGKQCQSPAILDTTFLVRFCCRHPLEIAWNQISGAYGARLIPWTLRKISEPAWSAQIYTVIICSCLHYQNQVKFLRNAFCKFSALLSSQKSNCVTSLCFLCIITFSDSWHDTRLEKLGAALKTDHLRSGCSVLSE